MAPPRISIVTPSYNQAEFIRDTLDSVERQTHSDIEHVVMDGGSTDGTLDVLREYESHDGYDLTWISEPDEGQSDAINRGFERASGDIVAWLNSDDAYFDIDALARVEEHFETHDADVIYGDLAYLDADSTVTEIDVRPDFDREKLPYRILIGQPATFFRRRVVEAEKLDTDLAYSMDYEYWLRLAERFEFRHVRDVLAGFRSYEAQKSQDQEAMAAELERILTEYARDDQGGAGVVAENLRTESKRHLDALWATYELHRDPAELAFDGELAPLGTMVANLGPGVEDVSKAWRRWRSGGASG
ncbi:MAG: glycosyltransferase family 2 protein [Halobacteriales archaeon]